MLQNVRCTVYRYDFHRGVDIPIPIGTPLVAIDDGIVRIAGSHETYSDGVVQVGKIVLKATDVGLVV